MIGVKVCALRKILKEYLAQLRLPRSGSADLPLTVGTAGGRLRGERYANWVIRQRRSWRQKASVEDFTITSIITSKPKRSVIRA
jgi:hypothetical protein